VPAAILATLVAYVSSLSPLAAIAALAAVLVLILVFTYPFGTLLLLIAALPWEGMLAYPSETVSVVKLAGLLLLVSFLISFPRSDKPLYLPPTSLSVAAFLLFVAISLIFSPEPSDGVGKMVSYALFAGFFFLLTQVIDDRGRLLTALRVLTISVTAAATWGLVQFLSGDADRAGGPISNPVDFGYLLAAFLPVAVYLMLEDRRRRWLWLACIPPIVAATLATLAMVRRPPWPDLHGTVSKTK